MTTTTTSILHRTVRLSAGLLIAGAVLTACGDPDHQVSSGPGAASAAAPAAAYVSPDQLDREAMLAVRNAPDPSAVVDRSAKLDLSSALAREAIASREANAAIDRSAKLDLTSALARQSSAIGSADALERSALSERTSAHRSADALEHWALSDSGS